MRYRSLIPRFARDFLKRRRSATTADDYESPTVDVRIASVLFDIVREHVEDFERGEEAGFLLCSTNRLDGRCVLLAREWHPIPESHLARYTDGSVLSWSAAFNSSILERAIDQEATLVLVHSHGGSAPRFSLDDRAKERPLFGAMSRIIDSKPIGTLLLGDRDAAGSFWLAGNNVLDFGRLVVIGDALRIWHNARNPPPTLPARSRLNRQSIAISPGSDEKLADARVGVIGLSGGGSHVVQQLSHQGVGGLTMVDYKIVEGPHLGRLVGAIESDVGVTKKVDLARRIANGIDRSIEVVRIESQFPSAAAIAALKEVDVIVACVDRFDAREAINAFCCRYLIPLVDIGMSIRSAGETLATADGQVIASIPGQPCLRCFFLTDAVLDHERRTRPPGYDTTMGAPGDPQVVSMNGVLGSEACNVVLDLLTGYSGGKRGAKQWQYDGRAGSLDVTDLPPARAGCPACAEAGFGDPIGLIG